LEQGFVNVKGGKLYYEVEGNGAPLVLIHAGFLDSRMWDEQFRIFAKHNKVIRYDVRGFGRSSRPKEEYSDAEDLFSLLNHLKIPKATILGISNGGRIAFDFTSTHPDMVTSLLLVAPGIRGYEGSPEEDKAWDETGKLMDAQDLAIKENRIDDAVRMDLEIWAPAQDEKNRTRLLQIATENSHIHKDPPNRLQKSPQPPAFDPNASRPIGGRQRRQGNADDDQEAAFTIARVEIYSSGRRRPHRQHVKTRRVQ